MHTKQGSVLTWFCLQGQEWEDRAPPSCTPAPILHRIWFWIVKLPLKKFKRKSLPTLEARVESHQGGERSLTTRVKAWGQELVAGLAPAADLGPSLLPRASSWGRRTAAAGQEQRYYSKFHFLVRFLSASELVLLSESRASIRLSQLASQGPLAVW